MPQIIEPTKKLGAQWEAIDWDPHSAEELEAS